MRPPGKLAAQPLRNCSQNPYHPGNKLKGLLYQMNLKQDYEPLIRFDQENGAKIVSQEVSIDAPQFIFAA
jgi:hypothetical protein